MTGNTLLVLLTKMGLSSGGGGLERGLILVANTVMVVPHREGSDEKLEARMLFLIAVRGKVLMSFLEMGKTSQNLFQYVSNLS